MEDTKKHPEGCMCMPCQGGSMTGGYCRGGSRRWGWMVLRVLISLFLLGVVFCLGVLVGEFKVLVGSGYRMMRFDGAYQGGQMMYGRNSARALPGGMMPSTSTVQ